MKIGNIDIARTAALAPMAGVADRAFREVCTQMGAAFVVGEMASAKGICYNSAKTQELLFVSQKERPMAVQLFGDDPITMAQAAKTAASFKPDWLDINMGCPAPKITGGGSGSSLLKNLPLAAEIIKAVVKNVEIPVTVKIRKGWDEESIVAVEAAQIAEQAGAAAITVHGRTRRQMYAPPVDTQIIARVKKAVSIPVIANGDVADIDSAIYMYEQTGCDLVMIGRAALGNPWVFGQIKHYMQTGEKIPQPPLEEKMHIMLKHIALACEYKGEAIAMREARTHAAWYLKGIHGAAEYRRQAGSLGAYNDLVQLADRVLKENVI